MTAQFSFLEISTNTRDFEYTVDKLTNLGFSVIGKNMSSTVSVWQLNLCVVFCRKDPDFCDFPSITGLGFICNEQIINNTNAEYIEDLEFYKLVDPHGLNIYLLPITEYKKSIISKSYTKFKTSKQLNADKLLKYFSGCIYNDYSDKIYNFYSELGFRTVKTGNQYINMVAADNRFTMVFNYLARSDVGIIDQLYCDTDDIFYTTAYCVSKKFNLKDYDINLANDFGDLAHKITGYNCLAIGNEESFSIENYLYNILPELNLILRMRKKFLHIDENIILEHARYD